MSAVTRFVSFGRVQACLCFLRQKNVFDFKSSHANFLTFLQITPIVSSRVNQTSVRYYAKGKDIKKEKGKKKVVINTSQISELLNANALESQMQKAVDIMKDDFTKQLSLRSASGSIESLVVSLDGNEHTLQELAQIARKNPKMVVISMANFPQAIPAVLKALQESGMNLNPQQEGTTLYLPVPKVTKEHRETLAKNAKSLFLKCKEAIRDEQIKQMKVLKKKEGASADLVRNVQEQVTALADGYIAQAEKILLAKQAELVGKE